MKYLFEGFLQVVFLIPLFIALMEKKSKTNYLRLVFFVVIYTCYYVILALPKCFEGINFIHGNWNWDGKILGIIFGLVCYYAFRGLFRENDFFTFRQNKEKLKITIITATLIVVASAIIWGIFGENSLNLETLAFQLSLPGIDEEIMFRCILLGLLLSTLKPTIGFFGNPAVLITAILFGFMHALRLNDNYKLHFDLLYFMQTGIAGYVWGWITWKSQSILLSILSHNFSNFFGTLVTML